MMDTYLLVLIHNTDGRFELIPLLFTLEGQHTHLNGSTLLDQYCTEEEEGVNGGVYPQPLDL